MSPVQSERQAPAIEQVLSVVAVRVKTLHDPAMRDEFAAEVADEGDDEEIRSILNEVCLLTDMGFAAVARVTEERWIAAQVLDKIEFGLHPGDELEIKKTICDEIRECGRMIVIDDIGADPDWRTHPVPMLYGFESYVSLPLFLSDGSFYGTLCAIDPGPRTLSTSDTISALKAFADRVANILSAKTAENLAALHGTIAKGAS